MTVGRRTIPALSCSDNQLREVVARLQQSVETLGNPAPAGVVNPPIGMGAYPGPIHIDFELTEPFDTNGEAEARSVKTDGTLWPTEPTPDPPAPTGSPVAPFIFNVCTWPGAHPDSVAGDRGTAVYREKDDGTKCWWVITIQEMGDPTGGPDGDFTFDDTLLVDDSGGPTATGEPTFNTHTPPPHSGGYICFTAGVEDSWVYFGDRGQITQGGMSWSGWFKGAHANADITIVNKQYLNLSAVAVAEWEVTAVDGGGPSQYFRFSAVNGANFSNAIGTSVTSADGTWSDDTNWHHIAVSAAQSGNLLELKLWVDNVKYENSIGLTEDQAVTRDEATDDFMSANTDETPPMLNSGHNGINTYCLDNFRFWSDRVLSDEEVDILFNNGVLE